MAYSTQRAVSDGSLNLLDISLDYFDRADISVYFNNIVQTTGWSWVGATEKKISFTPNVPAGVEVLVVRTSDLAAIRHEYSGGAQFTAETLDENMRQLLHIAQEARENANIEDVYRDLNMHGYKLKNVGAGVDPTDAITVQQASTFLDQAETAALLAEQWASGTGVIADGKYSAKHYAEQAAIAAANSERVPQTSPTGSASIPKGTTAERDSTPASGMFRFNTSTGKFEGYSGAGWGNVGGGATGGGSDAVFWENDKVVSSNYTVTAGKNAMTAGPVTIDNGVSVAVPSGSTWTVV